MLILGPNLHEMREEKIWLSSNAAFMVYTVSSRGGRNKVLKMKLECMCMVLRPTRLKFGYVFKLRGYGYLCNCYIELLQFMVTNSKIVDPNLELLKRGYTTWHYHANHLL